MATITLAAGKGQKMASGILVKRLLLLLLAAANVLASESNVVDAFVAAETWTDDWTAALQRPTTTTEDSQQLADVTLLDGGSGAQSEQPLDERFNKVDEGRHLMEQFYQRYNTTAQVDLVFVLDRSGSVPEKGWRSVIDFVKVCTDHRLSYHLHTFIDFN